MTVAPADVQISFWRGHVRLGVLSTAVCASAGLVYSAATWNQSPHRLAMVLIAGFALLTLPLILSEPGMRLFTNPGRDPYLYAWSCSLLVAVLGATALDGGAASPLTMLYGASLVFTASGFGRGGAIGMGAAAIGCYLVTCAIGWPGTWTVILTSCALLVMAGTCVLTAGRLRLSLETQEALSERLRIAASLDGLTGCLNRSALIDQLDGYVQRAHAEMRPLGFVALDLDDFKQVNDNFGHLAGDELLMTLGMELSDSVRDVDVVGRVGGDEFAVIVPDADEDAIRGVAERVRRRLQAVGASHGVDVSMGIATLYPHDDGRALRQRADEALYVSKGAATRTRLGTARMVPADRPSTEETSVY